jgi:S-ribosylhomocysteine lyase LuxS involved in autoinducer biosynthesis
MYFLVFDDLARETTSFFYLTNGAALGRTRLTAVVDVVPLGCREMGYICTHGQDDSNWSLSVWQAVLYDTAVEKSQSRMVLPVPS